MGRSCSALEPDIRAGGANVPGGPIIEIARLGRRASASSSDCRSCRGCRRSYNAIPNAGLSNFHENIPLRNLPLVTATPDENRDPAADRPGPSGRSRRRTPPRTRPTSQAPGRDLPVRARRPDRAEPDDVGRSSVLAGSRGRATLYRHDSRGGRESGAVQEPALVHHERDRCMPVSRWPRSPPSSRSRRSSPATGRRPSTPTAGGPFFETPSVDRPGRPGVHSVTDIRSPHARAAGAARGRGLVTVCC